MFGDRLPWPTELPAGALHGAGHRGDLRLRILPALGRPRLLLLSILCPALLRHDYDAKVSMALWRPFQFSPKKIIKLTPERSPMWLVSRGLHDEAREALLRLRGSGKKVE